MTRKRVAIPAAVLSGVTALAGCTTDSTPTPTPPSRSSPPSPSSSPSPVSSLSIDKTSKSKPFRFIDTFDGPLNESVWTRYDFLGTNNVGQRIPQNVKVEGGKLILEGTGNTISGLCFCGPATPDFAYGDYTFVLSATGGGGYVPAALMWPDSEKWPQDGEIDMVELPQADLQRGFANLHYPNPEDKTKDESVGGDADIDFTEPVTVTLRWRRNSVRVYYNDRLVLNEKTRGRVPKKSMHLAFQLDRAVDGWGEKRQANSADPFRVEIESVSVTPFEDISVPKGAKAPVSQLSSSVTLN